MAGITKFVLDPNEPTIVMTRAFDAPRRLVWEATSDPLQIPEWWGPRKMKTTVVEMEMKVGGKFHFIQEAPDGSKHGFKGEYLEVEAPRRVVHTWIYDVDVIRDFPALVTMTLEEQGGQTIMTTVTKHMTMAGRDDHYHSGMETGASESMDRLSDLLATLLK